MASKTSNPAPLATATGLGVVSTPADAPNVNHTVAALQAAFVRRRVHATPSVVQTIAELAFGRAA